MLCGIAFPTAPLCVGPTQQCRFDLYSCWCSKSRNYILYLGNLFIFGRDVIQSKSISLQLCESDDNVIRSSPELSFFDCSTDCSVYFTILIFNVRIESQVVLATTLSVVHYKHMDTNPVVSVVFINKVEPLTYL